MNKPPRMTSELSFCCKHSILVRVAIGFYSLVRVTRLGDGFVPIIRRWKRVTRGNERPLCLGLRLKAPMFQGLASNKTKQSADSKGRIQVCERTPPGAGFVMLANWASSYVKCSFGVV
jgi:hypothetical protein